MSTSFLRERKAVWLCNHPPSSVSTTHTIMNDHLNYEYFLTYQLVLTISLCFFFGGDTKDQIWIYTCQAHTLPPSYTSSPLDLPFLMMMNSFLKSVYFYMITIWQYPVWSNMDKLIWFSQLFKAGKTEIAVSFLKMKPMKLAPFEVTAQATSVATKLKDSASKFCIQEFIEWLNILYLS